MPADTGTVARTLQLLACFNERGEWPLGELASHLELPRSTVHRLLNLCRGEGYVDTDGDGVYRPGLALYRLSGRLAHQMPLKRIVMPLLRDFAARFGETSLLTVLDRERLKMYFAARAEPTVPIRYVIEMDTLGPLGWGASARALLAYMSQAEIAEVIRRAEPSPADGRPLDPDELLASLETIRKQGYAITQKQRTPQGVGIAVPFFDAAGEVIGNVTVTVPAFRYKASDETQFVDALSRMAEKVSAALGAPRDSGRQAASVRAHA